MPFFFAPKAYSGTPRGRKNGKTMQKWSGFDVLTIFLCSVAFDFYHINVFARFCALLFL